jgi:hypothetical protein
MSARNYAGGNWKDTQRSAEQYWRDTKGGWVGGWAWVGLRRPGWVLQGLGLLRGMLAVSCCQVWMLAKQ